MWLRWWLLALLVTAAAGKGKKHRHQKPGRALLDRLTSTNEGEVIVSGDAGSGLLPAPLDVAPYATVAANATCGGNGAEEYCRDTPGKRGVACDICEGLDGSSSRRHPASHAVDGDPSTWWQSPTYAVGEEFSHVEFVATLPDKMELLHVIMKSGPSPRPLAWSLEVSPSENSEDWHMVRAFGDREHCRRLWDLRPERRRRKARGVKRANRADKSTCSTQFVSPRPLENGEMHVGLGEGVWARRVRISFRGAHPAPALRRYYTLRALTLAARCLCHGHARHCDVDGKGAKCKCQHGTCGAQCSRCCDGGRWAPHAPCGDSAGDCECGQRGACSYDESGAIVCVNCTENRAGPLCDRCLEGFYSILPDEACRPCECDPEGSDGSCKWDKKRHKVSCHCRHGFTGSLCDACEDPGAVFPNCLVPTDPPCKCDPRGIVDPSRTCVDVCECKRNVMGDRCDTCTPGHYGLTADLGEGCRQCYCSHITDSCTANTTANEAQDVTFPLGESWLISDGEGNQTLESSVDEQGKPYIISYEVEGWESFFWYSSWWRGEQLTAYGHHMQASLYWGVVRGDTGGNPTLAPDFILVATDGTKLASTNTSHETPGVLELSVPLVEGGWYILGEEYSEPATRVQLMDVLRDLEGILLRAHFHFDQDEVRLESIKISGPSVAYGEQCACPAGYGGAHCSVCSWGHARVEHAPQAAPRFECVPCACNGHAACDTVEGPCAPCQHNTTGPHCERCLPGHYGNPVQGACKPCACPLYSPSNNFSPNCALASAEGDEFVCTQCPDGYTGDHCEHCDFGYWGTPTSPGSSCRPCGCGGAPCDPGTGECLTCPANTEGARCDQCKEGYWFGLGDLAGEGGGGGAACVPCECGQGALAAACDARTGHCACRQGWAGRGCTTCTPGHGGIDAGCPACHCGVAASSNSCDAETGACECASGAAPPHCDSCLDEYYGINSTGCSVMRWWTLAFLAVAVVVVKGEVSGPRRCAGKVARERLKAAEKIRDKRFYMLCCTTTCVTPYRRPRPPMPRRYQPYHRTWYGLKYGCNCSHLGAENNICDIRTGQCRCRPHVTGRACDTCEEGFWGLHMGGCRRCECGAGAAACDPVTGACACAPGVGGAQCDRCRPGYYGFRPAGCLACPVCSDGKICSPDNGQCVCPPRSRGPGCRQCAPGYWSRENGCQPCTCGAGAVSNTCDPVTGHCKCRSGWAGSRCEQCAAGHFGPRCRPCHCSSAGTRDCEDGLCDCDEQGRCPCKENVVGDKCDQCLDGTFGLSPDNPSGCTACFCFGRAAHCTQAALTRAALHAAGPQHVTLLRGDMIISTMDQNSPLAVRTHSPDATISLPWPPVPVYVELDNRFLGDRISSYGGALRFTVEEEGGEELPPETRLRFPLVSLYNKDIVLDYFERTPARNGTHVVRLHESLWRVKGRGGIASRSALMVVLQKLDRILLRVTTRAPTIQDNVHALLLNVSLDTAIPGLSRSAAALGVERCSCSVGFTAESCQRPAGGYWMPPPRVHIESKDGTIVIAMDGDVKRCDCNGRAVACDPDTGACLNCSGGTGGAHCEVCAAGYHGNPRTGCTPCPCPSRARNFAASCDTAHGRLQCLCKPGYAGADCEQCAVGWRRSADGSCLECACDPRGADSPHCDHHGRCRCRPFATGLTCDQCRANRSFLDHDGCKPCDNCTQTLLDSVEDLIRHLRTNANPTELSRIPKPFPALREFDHNASDLYTTLHNFRVNKERSHDMESAIENLEAKEHKIFTEANKFKTEAARRREEANYLSLESMTGLEEVLKQRTKLGGQVEALDEFARGERHLSAHKALKEAKKLLRHINDIKLIDYIGAANDVFDSAHLQLTAVQEYNYKIDDMRQRLTALQARLQEWERKTDELPGLGDTVWGSGDSVAALQGAVRPRLAAVRDAGLRCRLILEDITTLSASNLTDESHSSILRAQALVHKVPTLAAELATFITAAEEKEGILYSLTPVYKEKYLKTVEKHVAELGEKAMQYKSLFAGTRAASSLGVSAAHAWSSVADAVRDAAEEARAALATAAAAATLARGPEPMHKSASKGMRTSDALKKRGAEVLTKAEELRKQLEELVHSADAVSVSLRGLGWAERALGATPQAHVAGTLAAAGRAADRVFAATRALHDEAGELRRRVRYSLRRQLAELQRHGDTALGAAQEHVSQIRSNTVRGAELSAALAGAAAARAREQAAARGSLGPAVAALRQAVARARHTAHSISVSLSSLPSSPAGCSRSYALRWQSAAVTRLALALSFDGVVRDGGLLYLRTDEHHNAQDKQRYMKLTVENKKLLLRWNLGAGEGYIQHPEVLQPARDDDHTTYRVDVERIWNTVHLRVERAGASAVSASNSSGPAGVTLRTARVWLGAPPRTGALSGAGAPAGTEALWGLPACVHGLYSDDTTVGLWNFVEQAPDAQCSGCTQRWPGPRGGGLSALAWFGGGYAELRRTSLRAPDKRHFSLALTFRTRDENALLFMALDAANNRSVSLVLRECRVVFSVQYSGARLEITAGGRHCDGRPAHVQAIRVFANNRLEKGSLRVNGEETLGSPAPPVQSAAALPELAAARYWVGGLPPGAAPGPAPAPALLGCLGALQVDREGYDLLDTPARYAVEPSCGNRVLRSAILEGSGYIELVSPPIRRRAALGISFSARSSSGLLLYRAAASADDEDDDQHYLALVMVDGELEVIASAGKEELRLRTNGTKFDDRGLHTVRLVRAHKQLEVWVDEERISTGAFSGSVYAARPHGLYVGGAPLERSRPHVPTGGFTGTLSDVIVDGQLLGFENALKWSGCALGRADSSPHGAPRTEPRALHAQPELAAGCTKSPSHAVEAGAAKFGDAAGSHATLRLSPRGKFSLSMHFRTFQPDGLLALIPGSKVKPKHYTALLLREGRLRLIVRGRRRKEVALAAFVADGVWRSVTVRVWRSRCVVSSGGAAATAHTPPAARAHKLFVGGLPPAAGTLLPHLPNSIVRVGGFRGCIRRVVVGGRAEELVRSHHGLGQCFPNVEQAAYFAGDAYATWSSSWSWGAGLEPVLEARLQFRTAEPSGLLLAARPLLLELRDGAVVLTRQPPPGQSAAAPETVSSEGGGGRALCDNQWHAVTARVTRATLALAVDGGPELRGTAPGPLLDDAPAADHRAPLYVAGLPEGAMEPGDNSRENFKGCLRDVTVSSQKRDWTEMESLHNVLLDSCPIQQ